MTATEQIGGGCVGGDLSPEMYLAQMSENEIRAFERALGKERMRRKLWRTQPMAGVELEQLFYANAMVGALLPQIASRVASLLNEHGLGERA